MKYSLFWFFLALALGLTADRFLNLPPAAWLVPGLALAALSVFGPDHVRGGGWVHRTWSAASCVALLASSFFLGGFAQSASPSAIRERSWLEVADRGRPAAVSGIVSRGLERGETSYGRPYCSFVLSDVRLYPSTRATAFGRGPLLRVVPSERSPSTSLGMVSSSNHESRGDGRPMPGALQVYVSGMSSEWLKYGVEVRTRGDLRRPFPRRNPAGYDERAHLGRLGVFAVLHSKDIKLEPQRRCQAPFFEKVAGTFRSGVYRVRNRIIERMDRYLGHEVSGLSKALFIGERGDIEPGFKSALLRTGTFHLFSISGSNVAIVVALILGAAAAMRLGERPALVLALAGSIFYCALAGANPPVLRATLMASAFLAARLLARASPALNALGLAGAAILLWNPDEIAGAGFQLSFLAVGGLIWLAPRLSQRIRLGPDHVRGGGWVHRTWSVVLSWCMSALAVSVAAWAATSPVAIQTFHLVHLLSPVVNLLLAPVFCVLNFLLAAYSGLALLPWGAERLLTWPVALNLEAMRRIVVFFDRVPHALVVQPSWGAWLWVLFFTGLAVLSSRKFLRSPAARLAAVALFFLNCLFLQEAVAAAARPPYRITFFDVGQGDSIFFEFPRGGNLLVDTGQASSDGSSENVITPYLRSRGIERIDAVVITHPQLDHYGALAALLNEFEIRLVADNGQRGEGRFHAELLRRMREREVPRVKVGAGQSLLGYPGSEIRVLLPSGRPARDLNDNSVALDVRAAGVGALLTGDLGEEGITRLLSRGVTQTDILKVPHHGARIGGAALTLLRRVRPRIAVVQVGRRNSYGHPHPTTLAALEGLAGQTFRTDRHGAIQVIVDRETLEVKSMIERSNFEIRNPKFEGNSKFE